MSNPDMSKIEQVVGEVGGEIVKTIDDGILAVKTHEGELEGEYFESMIRVINSQSALSRATAMLIPREALSTYGKIEQLRIESVMGVIAMPFIKRGLSDEKANKLLQQAQKLIETLDAYLEASLRKATGVPKQ